MVRSIATHTGDEGGVDPDIMQWWILVYDFTIPLLICALGSVSRYKMLGMNDWTISSLNSIISAAKTVLSPGLGCPHQAPAFCVVFWSRLGGTGKM